MSRLLYAAARGARIQLLQKTGEWTDARLVWIGDLASDPNTDRIHPDDAHLQYGPISALLREYAETGDFPHTLTGLMARAAINQAVEYGVVWADDHVAFCLILAEFLADEGM